MTAISNSPIDAPRNMRGFTLIELLVVLAIIALIAVIAVPGFTRPNPMTMQRDRAALQHLISEARTRAILTGQPVDVTAKDMPAGSTVQSSTGVTLRWFPDGSALPARVLLQGRPLVTIDAVTGFGEDAQ
jgi:prepilin-type N-terminal cleavage/methylation domain-containing protein